MGRFVPIAPIAPRSSAHVAVTRMYSELLDGPDDLDALCADGYSSTQADGVPTEAGLEEPVDTAGLS